MKEETEVYKHPSFGLVSWGRCSGGKTSDLFGSSLAHNETITLVIRQGELHRSLNRDWYYGNVDLIEVQLTPIQFSEFITSPNIGSGTPCTIRYTKQDGHIQGKEILAKRQQFENEFEQNLQGIGTNFEVLRESVNGLKIPNKVKEDLLSKIYEVSRIVDDYIPFIQKSFNEQIDKSVMEAKSSVEAFVESKIRQVGLDNITSPVLLLDSNKEN